MNSHVTNLSADNPVFPAVAPGASFLPHPPSPIVPCSVISLDFQATLILTLIELFIEVFWCLQDS